ncbi:MAG: bifunctional oligoribonuclease/PAP phosphatase NrnA [Candidatus Omnitrophica bacterium]|nr:bifunctional oligoribonuclease/PAP phosphatase NrnA [Candidatus Omnitrophota bacterium]
MIREKIVQTIEAHQNFLIVAHVHPEGDSIASQLALAHLLRARRKTARILNADAVPNNLRFLPGWEGVERAGRSAADELNFEVVMILDCGDLERIGAVKKYIPASALVVNIDHHISNTKFGALNWVDPHASSTGEMIYQLFKTAGVGLDDLSALYLYVAIMTDTGSFRYSNTTSATHKIAAELLHFAIDPTKVYEYIYETKAFETLKMLGEVLNDLQRSRDGKIVWFKVTRDMMRRYKLSNEHTEHFIDFVRMVEGAAVAVFFREMDEGNVIKVSFRSKAQVDVNKIAQAFGGGGHQAASGCILEGDITQIEERVLTHIRAELRQRA